MPKKPIPPDTEFFRHISGISDSDMSATRFQIVNAKGIPIAQVQMNTRPQRFLTQVIRLSTTTEADWGRFVEECVPSLKDLEGSLGVYTAHLPKEHRKVQSELFEIPSYNHKGKK